jgi:hypothetical protein
MANQGLILHEDLNQVCLGCINWKVHPALIKGLIAKIKHQCLIKALQGPQTT